MHMCLCVYTCGCHHAKRLHSGPSARPRPRARMPALRRTLSRSPARTPPRPRYGSLTRRSNGEPSLFAAHTAVKPHDHHTSTSHFRRRFSSGTRKEFPPGGGGEPSCTVGTIAALRAQAPTTKRSETAGGAKGAPPQKGIETWLRGCGGRQDGYVAAGSSPRPAHARRRVRGEQARRPN